MTQPLSRLPGSLPVDTVISTEQQQSLPDIDRRHSRAQVEMLARFRRGVISTTVVLKDLTPFGAKVEGIGPLEADEVVTLTLPECRPTLAFVAWANDHGAGLEFVQPLGDALFAELVSQYGLTSDALPPSQSRMVG